MENFLSKLFDMTLTQCGLVSVTLLFGWVSSMWQHGKTRMAHESDREKMAASSEKVAAAMGALASAAAETRSMLMEMRGLFTATLMRNH